MAYVQWRSGFATPWKRTLDYASVEEAKARAADVQCMGYEVRVVTGETRDGFYLADGGFAFDFDRIARETGWTVDDIKARGVSFCRRNPRAGEVR